MKRSILALALVAMSFGAFAVQTPATSKKEAPKTEQKADKKIKKHAEKKVATVKVEKAEKPKKG